MAGWIVRLFGHPRVERDRKIVTFDTRKAVAILAYLGVNGQSFSRDTLAALLWPEYDHGNARAALRRTLSSLHKSAGEACLSGGWETVSLNPDFPIRLDVNEFRAHLAGRTRHGHPASQACPQCVSPLRAAIELYRGEFMEGFSLRDSAPFDEWQFLEAESLRREFSGALELLANELARQGQLEPAIDTARRWLAQDTLREDAHRLLMTLYARAGQQGAALRQYRECVRVLDQELGVAPLEETTRLYQEILERRSQPAAASRPAAMKAAAGGSPPEPISAPVEIETRLVGRAAEWAVLESALRGGGGLISLTGEAGVGKTYLAKAFSAQARAQGSPVLVGRCYPGEKDLAYSPFLDAIRSRLAQPDGLESLRRLPAAWLAETAWLLPELAPGAPANPDAEGPAAQSRFYEGLRQVLLALAGGPAVPRRPAGLLWLDDLHLADSASLEFLIYLVRRLAEQDLLVLACWVEDGSPAALRLEGLAAESARAGHGKGIRLRRFSTAEVAEMAGGELPAEVAARLQAEAEGLPFFVAEYLSAIKEGKLVESGGDWVLPHGVRELLRARLAGVEETGLQLLATAAVIGRSFELDSLQAASGRSEDETVAALEKLVARGLITEGHAEPGGTVRYDFNHEKLRALVYEETGLARRRLLHRRVAEALAGQARDPLTVGMQASQIAHHYHLAGQDGRAAEYFFTAGEVARRLHAHSEAIAHFQAALALGHPRAADLHEAIGDLQTLQGEYAGALASYEAAAAQNCGECIPRLEHKLAQVHGRRGTWEIAEMHLEAALEELGSSGDSGLRSQIYADLSQAAAQRGLPDRARECAGLARQLAESAGDWLALAQSYNILGILARSAGQPQEARGFLEQSLATAGQAESAGARMAALNNLALVHSDLDQVEEAVRLARQALEISIQLGDRHREAALRDHLADFYHALDQGQAAMEQLEKAVTLFAEIGVENGQTRPEIWKLSEW